MKNGFDYSQFEQFVKNYDKIYEEFQVWLKTFLLQQAQRVVANAKRRTPVDTGFLRAAYFIGNEAKALRRKEGTYENDYKSAFARKADITDIQVVGDTLQVTISNEAEYASYVEWGHSTKAGGWIEGHFMLSISISEVENAMPTRFNRAFMKFMKERGGV